MNIKKFLPILIIMTLTSCGFTLENSSINSSNEDSSNFYDSIISDSSSNDLEDSFSIKTPNFNVPKRNSKEEFEFNDLFNLANKVEVKVEISQDQLSMLQNDYVNYAKSEIYRVADKVEISITNYQKTFTWEYENVGIRQKGNTSRESILIDGKINNHNHFKLSFDETFDDPTIYSSAFIKEMENKIGGEDYSKRDFLGLSGLDFKWNKNCDLTHIKEVYANNLYRASGIIAQHTGLSTFSMINNFTNEEVSFGLCTMFEPASKSLIKRSLSSEDKYFNLPNWDEEQLGEYGVINSKYGDYYKCTYGVGSGYSFSGANLSYYNDKILGIGYTFGNNIPAYERKTNTKDDYDDFLLKRLIDNINSSSYSEISKYIDLKQFAIYEAVSYVIGNPDSLRYNYNNYLLYFSKVDAKARIIPYDNDRCFGIIKDLNFKNALLDTNPLDMDTLSGVQNNKLYLKTILSNDENYCKDYYIEVLNEIAKSSWVSPDTFNRFYQIASATYNEFEFSQNDDNVSFADYMKNKKLSIKNDDEIEIEKIYDNLYLVGNFNSWGDYPQSEASKYHFEYLGDYQYQLIFEIPSDFQGDVIYFKINAGGKNYSDIDWTLNSDLTKLIMSVGGNVSLKGIKSNDKVKININTDTLNANVEIL